MPQPVIFISYSHQDEREKGKLLSHLKVLQHQGLIDLWSDDRIGAGADWKQEINEAISLARVAILLITANFLTSDFILNKEVPALLKRRESEGLIVFPVIAKACAWNRVEWLTRMKVRPKNGRPIWGAGSRRVDEDLAAIAEEVAAIVNPDSFILPTASSIYGKSERANVLTGRQQIILWTLGSIAICVFGVLALAFIIPLNQTPSPTIIMTQERQVISSEDEPTKVQSTASHEPASTSKLDQEDNQVIISDISPTPTPTPTSIPNTPTSTPTSTTTPTTQPTPTISPTPDALPSGSTVNTDDGWALRVVDVKYSDRLDNGNLVYIAEGRYVHLILEVTNNNRRKDTFLSHGNLELVTGSGLSYEPDGYADIINNDAYGIEWNNQPIEIEPGEKGFDVVTFDLPLDSYGPYMLQGGILEDLDAKVLVNIQ